MHITSLYYFLELTKDLNMTKTAERLYISQQTLSNHIQRLEKYYDSQLLNRKPSLSLTYAGIQVRDFAEIMIKEHENLKGILSDIEDQKRGVLNIGASIARGIQFLPRILPKFLHKYPFVEVRLTNTLSSDSEQMLLEGELDFSIVFPNYSNPSLTTHELLNEQIYLCVPDSLIYRYYGRDEAYYIKARSMDKADIRDFSRLPFCIMRNRLGVQVGLIFEQANIKPDIYFTAETSKQILPVCAMGLAACYCTHMSLVENRLPGDINIFPLFDGDEPVRQKLAIIRNKQRYLTRYSRYFLEVMFETVNKMEHVNVRHLA